MNPITARTILAAGRDSDASGGIWKNPDLEVPDLSLVPVESPGGYPSPLGPLTIGRLRRALETCRSDGSLGRPTSISYISALGRLAEWLNATDRVVPGGTWEITDLDLVTARAFLAHVKAGWSKNQTWVSKSAIRWAYKQCISQERASFGVEVLGLIDSIEYADLGSPDQEGGAVPMRALPAEPDLPILPMTFKCGGTTVMIDGLRMVREGTGPAVGLERIVRPAGRPSILSQRSQQVALLYMVEEIQSSNWSRHQILNAVDRFARWLAWHPEWRTASESFEWSSLSPDLAESYFSSVRDEPKGSDWWIFLRGLYRWGVRQELDGFDRAVERQLLNVGNGRALTVAASQSEEEVRSRFTPNSALPPIPPGFRTRDGKYVVRTESPIWRQRDDEGNPHGPAANLALLDDPPGGPEEAIYTLSFLHLVRLYIVQMASKEWSWVTTGAFLSMLRVLQTWLRTHRTQRPDSFGVEHLNASVVSAYKMHLEGAEGPGYSASLSMLRRFYTWGRRARLPDFDTETLERLKELAFTNPPSGELVKALDPRHGAFSMVEQMAIQDALDDPEWGTTEEKALVRLCWYLGPRPVQICAIKVKHFEKLVTPHGITYIVSMPRCKKGYPTEETVPRSIPVEYGLGQLLEELCPEGTDPERALFPSFSGRIDNKSAVGSMLKRWAHRSGPRPLRTLRVLREGKPDLLNIHAYRFRRTMATNLALQGASAEYVAMMLDDDDIRMALTYTENISQFTKVLGDTVDAGEYLDIVGGFLGEFESKSHQSLPEIQPWAVDGPGREELLDLGGTGRCGKGALCHLAWPMSCYACRKFKPRPGGPHEQMLANVDRIIAAHRRQGLGRMVIVYMHIRARIAIVVEADRRKRKAVGFTSQEEISHDADE